MLLPRIGGLLPLTLLLVACAGAPKEPPRDEIASADLAYNRALETEAAEFAALEMRMAQDKLQQARSITAEEDRGQYEKAERLAEQAAVDARLAEVKAERARMGQLRDQMEQTVDALREATPAQTRE